MRPYLKKKKKKKKNPSQKRAAGVAQGVGPEFTYQTCKKKKKKRNFAGHWRLTSVILSL
jgi:hypothetical protein